MFAIVLMSLALACAEPFRFHLFTESHSVDPQRSLSANSNYVYHLLYRGLYRYGSRDGLRPAGAKVCVRSALRLTCTLDTRYRWSDGTVVKAADYVASFRRLLTPKLASPNADLLFTLKNAAAIWRGETALENLGVRARGDRTLIFEFATDDPEFEYKLVHPALSPLPKGGYPERGATPKMPTNGPYRIAEWKSGSYIRFESNPHYPSRVKTRPPAEAWIVDEDATALRMFESGKLSFLRRLPAVEVPRYRDKPSFHQIPQARFDYVGFSPALSADVREALVKGVDYKSFLSLFYTLSPPGCPSLPRRYYSAVECLPFERGPARAALERAGKPKLELHFSRMGGDDIARQAEWWQGQWRRNLDLSVELKSQEQGVYVAGLKVKAPPIFRKGVSLDRPTCTAGLELFTRDHPENFIKLDDPAYDQMVLETARARGDDAKKNACAKALAHLLASNRLIPLGEMYFTILVDPRFRGWDLNELNQLDLGELSFQD